MCSSNDTFCTTNFKAKLMKYKTPFHQFRNVKYPIFDNFFVDAETYFSRL